MNQNSNFPRFGQQGPQQYGLHSYDAPPRKAGIIERVFGPSIAAKFSSPLFATSAFVLTGVAFAALIVAVYPDSNDGGEVPTVTADTLAYKEAPTEPGGMVIPNRDSTVFSAMNNGETAEPAPIENLFGEEEPVDKLAAFARQVEETAEQGEQAVEEAVDESLTIAANTAEETKEAVTEVANETAPVTLQKIAQAPAAKPAPEELAAVEPAASEAERPKITHKAGENPDTLEFVKSVLDQKDSKVAAGSASDVATRAATIAPAAGTPGTFDIAPGDFFVQLASVKSLSGAESEWGKLQKEFEAELGAAPHRVQAADLGDRGTFFRIQAGPMSKSSATKICDSIKSQKPGGCLVTQ
ncbi:MAG: SPOR domain-containing protein [Pseudomonadota bacterium]